MPVLATLLALSVFTHLTGHVQDPGESAVGMWLSEATTQGGLGSWVELRDDGTASISFGALVEGTYTMKGASLRLVIPRGKGKDAPRPDTSVVEMRIDGNTATRMQPPPADLPPEKGLTPEERAMFDRMKQPLQMTRVGTPAPDAAPIVGTWAYPHYTGGTAYELYTRGGVMVLMVPMQVQQATYSKRADALTLHLPEGTATIVAKGDVLTLTSPDGRSATYRRAPR